MHATREENTMIASPVEPVAVVGAACRLPGGVDSVAQLWALLEAGREAVTQVPPDRWDTGKVEAELPPGIADRICRGGFLDGDIAAFDPDFFGISRPEAAWLDPQHRLLLEVAWEACEHAGIPVDVLRGSATGVFTGMYVPDHLVRSHRAPLHTEPYWMTGAMHGVGAGRLSYLMDLHGPSLAVDTACSSSLVAVHLACQSLRSGECDAALAGGASVILSPEPMASEARWDMFSPTGHCHCFDAAADGYVRSEGCGVVVLKRLSDARRDGDQVLALLRGSAVNQDGRSTRLTAPSQQAQQQVCEQALARAGVAAADVGMVEAHGAGTAVGDPIEFAALNAVYGPGPGRCALGSLKSNIGHTEPTSGVAGLLKAIASLQRGTVPATLHFTRWNPQIDAEGSRLFVPTAMTPWPVNGRTRLAGVSSYGVGGTNAHLIVEQAPAYGRRYAPGVADPARAGRRSSRRHRATPLETALLSGGSPAALASAAARLADWLETDGAQVPLRDVSHTLSVRRSHARHRLGVVAGDRGDLVERLRAHAEGRTAPGIATGTARDTGAGPVFIYSGHGSQWATMGQGLLGSDPDFSAAVDEMEPLLRAEGGFSLRAVLTAPEVVTGVDRVQPVIFAFQIALTAMWRARGIRPAAVIGHSMGEVAAAVTAGALSLRDGVRVICRRARLLKRTAGRGAMVSVQLGAAEVEQELDALGADEVTVAVVAAPRSTVISGDAHQVEHVLRAWEEREIAVARVQVDVASHSAQMDPVLDDLRAALNDLAPRTPGVPFYTTVLEDPRQAVSFDAGYWVANQRRPVRFSSAVSAATEDGHSLFLEINAHPLLVRPALATLAADGKDHIAVLPSLYREQDEHLGFATQLAAAHCAGYAVDWSRWYGHGRLAEVPPTTWERHHHWVNPSPLTQDPAPAHPLLGPHARDPQEHGRSLWQTQLNTQRLPWLADHRLAGLPVLPAAGYCEAALAAAAQLFPDSPAPAQVSGITFLELLSVDEHDTTVAATADRAGDHAARWEMSSRTGEEPWTRHTTARLHPSEENTRPAPADLTRLAADHPVELDLADFQGRWHTAHAVDYGSGFSGLTTFRVPKAESRTALAEVGIPDEARPGTSSFHWHPALLDACLQAFLALWTHAEEVDDGHTYPRSMTALRRYGDTARGRWCHIRLTAAEARSATGDLQLLDAEGQVLAEAEGVRFAHTAPAGAEERFNHRLYQQTWEAEALPAGSAPNGQRWLLLTEADGDPRAAELAAVLKDSGAETRTITVPPGSPDAVRALSDAVRPEEQAWSGIALLPSRPSPTTDPAEQANLAHRRVHRLIRVVQALAQAQSRVAETAPRLWVITDRGQAVSPGEGPELACAGLRGLVRVLSYEHPELHPTVLDVDADTSADAVATELLSDGEADEVAWRGSERLVARLVRAPLQPHERRRVRCRYEADLLTLQLRDPAAPDTAELTRGRLRPLRPGEVEIQLRATGLPPAGPTTREGRTQAVVSGAGTVTAVHDTVRTPRVGDRVATLLPDGVPASRTVTRADWTLPVPGDVAFEDAAALPLPYLTAWYGLRDLARLAPGDDVLIHSAGHSTGLAAVHVARALGATVRATAPGRDHNGLRRLGVEHLVDSQAPDTVADHIREATGGRGMDIVFTPQPAAASPLGPELLAPGGRYVEILGARNDAPGQRLPLPATSITASRLDPAHLLATDPERVAGLLAETAEARAAGRLPLLPTTTAVPVTDAGQALRALADPAHTSTPILAWPACGSAEAVVPPHQVPLVRPDGSYLITGGLGGLGMLLCRWLARKRAGTIVLNSRSAPGPEAARIIDGLRADGSRVEVVRGDIAAPGTAERLVRAAQAHGHPLRGVLHAALVLEDAVVDRIDDGLLERVWQPKTTGALHLHQASSACELDWWVAFSSFVSLVGSPGQGAYAAAGAWLDEFVSWRSAQGLPTTGINWGPWAEAGRGAAMGARDYDMIAPADGLDALEHILAHDRTRTGYIALDLPGWLEAYPDTAELPYLAPLLSSEGRSVQDTADGLLADLNAATDPQQRRDLLQAHIAGALGSVLNRDTGRLDTHTALVSLGLDSLLTIELRNRLQRSLQTDIPRNVMWTQPTLSSLTDYLLGQLPEKG